MKIERVEGSKKDHKVFVYALSTCGWCAQTKKFLKNSGIEFEFVDVDRCNKQDLEKIKQEITAMDRPLSFPLIIIDNGSVKITGFREDELKKALGL
ncbi:MAG: glutaredoxin family protein [Candidatus Methanomethylicia archaeon]|nr:glutaredoxin family protein [Candidatus Methanomethylicia archaeon]